MNKEDAEDITDQWALESSYQHNPWPPEEPSVDESGKDLLYYFANSMIHSDSSGTSLATYIHSFISLLVACSPGYQTATER